VRPVVLVLKQAAHFNCVILGTVSTDLSTGILTDEQANISFNSAGAE